MKKSTRIVRDFGAAISIIALVAMLFLAFLFPGLEVSDRAYFVLLGMISAFLGIDIIRERWELLLRVVASAVKTYFEHKEDNGD